MKLPKTKRVWVTFQSSFLISLERSFNDSRNQLWTQCPRSQRKRSCYSYCPISYSPYYTTVYKMSTKVLTPLRYEMRANENTKLYENRSDGKKFSYFFVFSYPFVCSYLPLLVIDLIPKPQINIFNVFKNFAIAKFTTYQKCLKVFQN